MNTHSLHLGDCLEYMKTLPEGAVDAVITDPPYGIGLTGGGMHFQGSNIAGDENHDAALAVADYFTGTSLTMFYSPFRPYPIKWRSVLTWAKGAHVGIGGDRETCWKRDFELIGIRDNRPLNGMRDSAVLMYQALSPPPSGHVAEKPVKLMTYLISKLTQPGDTIFDPFMGSGTTGVACMQMGRNFIGCEIDEGYFKIAQRRIEDAAAQLHLFEMAA